MPDPTCKSSALPLTRLRRRLLYLLLFPLLVLMLLFPQTAASGAMNGLTLWSQTLLPVLLPFLILSGLLITLKMTRPLNLLLSPLLCRIFPVSRAACYPLVLGLLCGMPLGAKTTADLYRSGEISESDARFLLGFSNQASLMFIISYVTAKELAAPAHTAVFLAVIYLTGWIVSGCMYKIPFFYSSGHEKTTDALPARAGSARSSKDAGQLSAGRFPCMAQASGAAQISTAAHTFGAAHTSESAAPASPESKQRSSAPSGDASARTARRTAREPAPSFFAALDGCIIDGFATITKIGGYVILFSMLSAFFMRLPLPEAVSALLCGALEITGGIHKICAGSLPAVQKTALTIGLTAFGGISGILQTKSVTLGSGLSIRYYVIVKLAQGICAGLLTCAVSVWLAG